MKCLYALFLALMMIFFCNSAIAKKEVTRRLGGACGEDSGIRATCASGLSCKSGTCQMNSFLSSATVGCKTAMQNMGVDSKTYVAVHDGFCYIDSECRGLYEKAMAADEVTKKVLGPEGVDPNAMSHLSDDERETLQAAVDACQSCGKCVIGRQFLGRGGY